MCDCCCVGKKPQDVAFELLRTHLEVQHDSGTSIKSDKEQYLKIWDEFLSSVRKSMVNKAGHKPTS